MTRDSNIAMYFYTGQLQWFAVVPDRDTKFLQHTVSLRLPCHRTSLHKCRHERQWCCLLQVFIWRL